jgi:hypothetical protein
MASEKISQMTPADPLAGADLIPIVQGGANKKLTVTQLSAFVGAIGAPVTGGTGQRLLFVNNTGGGPILGDLSSVLWDGDILSIGAFIGLTASSGNAQFGYTTIGAGKITFDDVAGDAAFASGAHTLSSSGIGFFGNGPTAQQTSAPLTNNVTAGGTSDTIEDYSSLTVYTTDAAAIRNNLYQLARKLKEIQDAMYAYGILNG